MTHSVPEPAVICTIVLSVIVLTSASLLSDQHPDVCPPSHVTCRCGRRRGGVSVRSRVSVPVRRCIKFDGFSRYCDDCTPHVHLKKRLCPKFKHCKSCNSHGCVTCPDNRYGHLCKDDCSSLCFNGGTCRNMTCICAEGFIGERCESVKAKDCTVVTKPANGNVTVSKRIATYSCAQGYNLIGQKRSRCKHDGTWSSDAPVCESICVTPNASEHLFFTRQELYDDEHESAVMKLEARCDNNGYRLVGARAVYCNLDGTWSSLPYCAERGRCTEPHVIANGHFQSFSSTDEEDYFEGTEVTYECDIGFVLNGSHSLICNEDGKWSSDTPRCVAERAFSSSTCPKPVQPENGGFNLGSESKVHKFVPGVRVVYSCDEGYVLHPHRTDYHCHHNGTWVPARDRPPRCIKVTTCPDPGYPEHGKRCFGAGCSESSDPATFCSTCVSRAEIGGVTVTLPEGNYVNGTYVEFACSSPYRMRTGSAFSRCGPDGTWTNPKPRCDPVCGHVPKGSTSFIFNGKTSLAEDWPWHVLVKTRGERLCGGVLLGDSWVVTAAHCVSNDDTKLNASILTAEFGKQNISSAAHSPHAQIRRISRVIVHNDYLPLTHDSDIALLEVSKPLKITSHVTPVCLKESLPINRCTQHSEVNRSDTIPSCDSDTNENAPNLSDRHESHAYVSGFGQTSGISSKYSQVLRSARVLVEGNNARCMEILRSKNVTSQVTENMFCAGNLSHPCAGDSGGPLVTNYKGRFYLQGIVSWGPKNACRSANTYGVFTNVPKFYKWIQRTTSPDLTYYK